MVSDVKLMDVTIREGSFPIDFKFTTSQITAIAKAIDTAGVPYMEVGNGGGLGMPDEFYRGIKPQLTDIEQLRVAKKVVKHCKIGLLANPHPFTKKEHIEAVKGEVDFLRVAAKIEQIEEAEQTMATAKKLKVPIFFQMTRSSLLSPTQIMEAAKKAEGLGADVVYVVDSFGHFIPQQISAIVQRLKQSIQIPIGFHGHNNLMMAVANSVAAAEAGAQYIDASLSGFGRDAGNTQLEVLALLLQRIKKIGSLHVDQLIQASHELIEPIMPRPQGAPPYQAAMGEANMLLYPIDLYQATAHIAEIDFLVLLKKLREISAKGSDIKSYLSKALQELGKNPEPILKKLGLS